MTNEDDIPRKSSAKPIFIAFVIGLGLGVAATIIAPRFLQPYLPDAMVAEGDQLRGPVIAEKLESDRLLLTVNTQRGAVLVAFKSNVTEIDLLIDEGDTIGLALTAYEPFVEDPEITEVIKPGSWPQEAAEPDSLPYEPVDTADLEMPPDTQPPPDSSVWR